MKKMKKYNDQDILDYLIRYKRAHGGNTPKIRELVAGTGMSSNSVATFRLDRLVKNGKLERLEGGAYRLVGDEYIPPQGLRRIPLVVLGEIVRAARAARLSGDEGLLGVEVALDEGAVAALLQIAAAHPEPEVANWIRVELGRAECKEQPATPGVAGPQPAD